VFSTADDNQTTVEIHVLQGERELARDNRTIGKFQLTGIPPAPRGVPQVEVTFDIDANGILHVAAKDKATGKEQKIRIEASSGLSESEIDRMVKDAEKNAASDKERREEIDTRNRLDSMTYEVEKNAKEWSDKLPADLKGKLDAAVERSRKALRGDDMGEIRAAQEDLSKTFAEAGQSFYAQSQAAPEGGTAPEGAPAAEGAKPKTWSRPTTRSLTTARNNKHSWVERSRAPGTNPGARGRCSRTLAETKPPRYVSIWGAHVFGVAPIRGRAGEPTAGARVIHRV